MVRRLVAFLVLLAGCQGDTVSSAHDGEMHIVTEDGGIIALRPDSVFRVDQYRALGGADDTTVMSLLSGAVRSITGWIGKHDHSAYRLSTPTATLGIRGTDHEVAVIDKGNGDEPGTYDTVNEGATVMKTPHGEAEVAPGKFSRLRAGRWRRPFWRSARISGPRATLGSRIASSNARSSCAAGLNKCATRGSNPCSGRAVNRRAVNRGAVAPPRSARAPRVHARKLATAGLNRPRGRARNVTSPAGQEPRVLETAG